MILLTPVLLQVIGWQRGDALREAKHLYTRWLLASPLDRLGIYPQALVELHQTGRFSRVEQKAVPMLLKCVGADLREDIVTSRLFSTAAIVYKTMCKYQPGGSAA